MKPNLIIGLGNPLMGDEGAAWHALERLAADRRLRADTELFWAGADLLRAAGRIEGRRHVVLLDALLAPERVGTVSVFEQPFTGLDYHQQHAHHLSAVQAIGLLESPARFTLVAMAIAGAACDAGLSAEVEAAIPAFIEEALRVL